MSDPVTVEPVLSPSEDPSEPIRRGPTHRRPIPPCERPEAPDHFAPIHFVALAGPDEDEQ